MAILQNLPTEIIDMIVSALDSNKNSLCSLCRVSRDFDAIFRSHVWHTITLKTLTDDREIVIGAITRNPKLGFHVRQLTICRAHWHLQKQECHADRVITGYLETGWIQDLYNPWTASWFVARAHRRCADSTLADVYIILHMPKLRILRYRMNQKDDKDLVFELFDHCRYLRFRKEGPHLLQGARNMRLPLVALETLRFYDDTRVQPLPSSATQLPRLETLHLTSPQFGLADRTGFHSDTMRSIIISGGKFHEDHVRDILMSMPNLSSFEYEADDHVLVTKTRTNDLGDTLRKFGGGLTHLALRISSY